MKARAVVQGYSRANCEVAARTAERVGLGPGVVDALLDVTSSGTARAVRGGSAARRSRDRRGSRRSRRRPRCSTAWVGAAWPAAVRQRAGRALDPELVESLARRGGEALNVLDQAGDSVMAAVGAEPEPLVKFGQSPGVERVCRAFGEVVDIKTPLHHGHCTGVAALAAAAAERSGLAAGALPRAGSSTTSGAHRCPTASGSTPVRWAGPRRSACACTHTIPSACSRAVGRLRRSRGWPGRITSDWTDRDTTAGDRAGPRSGRAAAGGGGRHAGAHRAARPPAGAVGGRGRRGPCRRSPRRPA